MIEILFYADSRGRQPVLEWMEKIKKSDPVTYRATYQKLVMLQENGKLYRIGKYRNNDIKKLTGSDIWQLRINDNRILYFYFTDNAIVLTNQFKKDQNSTPKNEIKRAEKRMNDWLKRH